MSILFITSLVLIAMLVLQIRIYNTVKAGRQLPTFQSNVAASYINWSRKLGVKVYLIIGLVFLSIIAINAVMVDAWLSFFTVVAYVFVSMRTQKLLRNTSFQAVDAAGNYSATGAFLKPAQPQAVRVTPLAAEPTI